MNSLAQTKRDNLRDTWYEAIHSIWTRIVLAIILVILIVAPKVYYNTEPNLYLVVPLLLLFGFLTIMDLGTDCFQERFTK